MACDSLISYSRECGKNTKSGSTDVYLIAFSDLKPLTGSTDVYATAVSGLISQIGVTASGGTSSVTKYVKYGTVINQNSIKETYSFADNGSYDIEKELTFSLTNVGSVDGKLAIEKLISGPVSALVKLKTGTWIAFGLNGQFMAKSVAGEVSSSANGRVITLSGSDENFLQPVDPTIISSIIV